MTKIEQHIEDSIEEFYKKFGHIQVVKNEISGNSYNTFADFLEQSQLELIEAIRGEVEKIPEYDGVPDLDNDKWKELIFRQDVLDLLKINRE